MFFVHCIAYNKNGLQPVGTLWPIAKDSLLLYTDAYMECDGRTLKAADYPELFAVLGQKYGPFPTVLAPSRAPRWLQKIFRFADRRVPNPHWSSDVFALPDLRSPYEGHPWQNKR
ncbi:tail fiber protein [Escherichia coli]|nr:tail fiber protein [Escherichia coli]